jgi:hypothetical protein
MFDDRRDAGRQLAMALADYGGKDVVVLAIPRGGVEVGYQVAMAYLLPTFPQRRGNVVNLYPTETKLEVRDR